MRVAMKTTYASEKGVAHPGGLSPEIDEAEAAQLVREGCADYLPGEEPKPAAKGKAAPEKKTDPEKKPQEA